MHKISDRRRKYIDSVADYVLNNYTNGDGTDWDRLADDISVNLIRDNRTIRPSAGKVHRKSDNKEFRYVCVFDAVRDEHISAHEFGHTLLAHFYLKLPTNIMETEADYFARKFAEKDPDNSDKIVTLVVFNALEDPRAKLYFNTLKFKHLAENILELYTDDLVKEHLRKIA